MDDPPARDLIVLHLAGYGRFSDHSPVPAAVSASGIRAAIGVEREGVAERVALLETVDRLESEGLVTEDVRPVEGGHRRNVYFLTERGAAVARTTRERWRTRTVDVPEADEPVTVECATKYVDDGSLVSVLAALGSERLGRDDADDWHVVGRETELATLEASLSRVPEEGSRTLLLSGAAGSGKSTLLSHLASEAAEAGYDIALGSARRDGGDPYAPVRNAFSGVDATVVDRLMASDLPAVDASDDLDTHRVALFADVRDAVRDLAADGPLVFAIDDCQWADEATLELFAYLSESITEWIYPVLFVAGYRPEAVADDETLSAVVDRLRDRDRATGVTLSPLATHHVHTLLRDELGDHDAPDGFVDRLREITGGNPLFIAESVRYLQTAGLLDVEAGEYPDDLSDLDPPDAVQTAIGHRLDRLDETGHRVVSTAAVIGDGIRWDLLSGTVPLPAPDLRDYVDLLVESRVLEWAGEGRLEFPSEFARDTALSTLDPSVRRAIHARVASAVPTVDADVAGDQFGRIAHHYEQAGATLRALAYYRRAAEQGADVYAIDAACDAYRRAIDIAERTDREAEVVELYERLGQFHRHTSAFEDAESCFEAVLERTDDPTVRSRIANERCLTFTHRGEYDAAIERANHGLAVGGAEPSSNRCKLVGQRGWIRMVRGSLDAAREDFETERKLAVELDDPELVGDAFHHLGSVEFMSGDLKAGIEAMRRAIETRDRADDERGLGASLNNLSAMQWKAGRLDDARESVERSLEITRKRNDRATEARMTVNLGLYVEKAGDWDRATDHYAESLETVTELGITQTEAVARENLGSLHLRRGALSTASDHLKRALALNREIDHTRQAAIVRDRLSELAAVRDRPERAREHADAALDLASDCGDAEREAGARARLGDAHRRADRLDAAIDCHETGASLAEETGGAEVLVHNRAGLALDHRAAGRTEAALDHAEAAVDDAASTADPWLRTLAVLARGRCHHAAGHPDAAGRDLSSAADLSRDLDASLTACRAAVALAAVERDHGDSETFGDHRRRARSLADDCGFERLGRRLETLDDAPGVDRA